MGDWLNGFTIGLMLGTSAFSAISALQRRSQLRALEGLLQNGAYRVVKADGSSTAAGELLGALGGRPAQRLSKGRLAALLAAGVATGVLAVRVIFATR